MPEIKVNDERFRSLVDPHAPLRRLFGGTVWAEGPCYIADTRVVVWSDIPNNRMMRWVEGLGSDVFRSPSNFSNGNTRDREGRLVTCEHGTRRVARTEHDGSITVIADRYSGKRFNSPNDVVVKSDGSIWFTDPDYGILSDFEGYKSPSEIGRNNVYRVDPVSGTVSIVCDDFDKPNGIAFSPDEKRLYVADTGASHREGGNHHIRVFEVASSGKLSDGRVFAEIDPGLADGFRLDVQGNLWTSAGDGIHCFNSEGALLGKILVPEVVANLTFGGPDRKSIFIAASTSLYLVKVSVQGAQRP